MLEDPQSWNAYAYARNNPFMYVDPDGRQWQVPQGSPGSRESPFRVTVTGCDSDCQARESFNRFVFEHRFQLIATEVSERAGALASPRTYLEFYGLSAMGGLGVAGGVSLFGGAGLTPLSLTASAGSALTGLSKVDAQAALQGMCTSAAQLSSALRSVAKATTSTTINIVRQGGDVVVQLVRPGANGRQVIESVITPAGNKTVVQKAYDAGGALVHYHPK